MNVDTGVMYSDIRDTQGNFSEEEHKGEPEFTYCLWCIPKFCLPIQITNDLYVLQSPAKKLWQAFGL